MYAVDADEQHHRGPKALVVARVLAQPGGRSAARNSDGRVQILTVLKAARAVGLPQGRGIDRVFGRVAQRMLRHLCPNALHQGRQRRAGEHVHIPGLQIPARRAPGWPRPGSDVTVVSGTGSGKNARQLMRLSKASETFMAASGPLRAIAGPVVSCAPLPGRHSLLGC